MAKCFGEFICSKCGTVTKKAFDISSSEEIEQLYVDCKCGKRVETFIPASMREPVLNLASKGYKMRMFNENILGIVFNGKLNEKVLPKLPHEFTLDCTEPEGDILRNDRMVHMDFAGMDQKEYTKQAIINLLDFCRLMPTVSDGEYIDLTKE